MNQKQLDAMVRQYEKKKEQENILHDPVVRPLHYQISPGVEVMDVIEALVMDCDGKIAYQYGSVLKYILRCMKKNGIEDVKKARYHLDKLIERMEEA